MYNEFRYDPKPNESIEQHKKRTSISGRTLLIAVIVFVLARSVWLWLTATAGL